ncbi:MAG: protein kinase family protein [Arcobacter sp.]|uniref:protein kinase family protein n=1 Tax=Arcobacter sp. TaxID=1872629 RepID=UPI003AFF800A
MDNHKYIEIYIDNKYLELINEEIKSMIIKYLPFYDNIENVKIKYLFAYFHFNFNTLFNFLNQKIYNSHYNAHESRELINSINEINNLLNELENYKYSYTMKEYYKNTLNTCSTFLSPSGGSQIPEDFEQIKIIESKPIFELTTSINVNMNNFKLKLIGEGSYAKVFKYKDNFYNKHFALKKAKTNLNLKELERFKLEYNSMKQMNSPYILEVYNYDENENSYSMEYADITLLEYINKNNTKLIISQRKNIINQVFKAFNYINEDFGLHRDISTTNTLLKIYDNNLIVVKISDFGLIKIKESVLTSDNTEYKGSLNDPKLDIVGGFKNYKIFHETFALTRLIYFIMTGKLRIDKIDNLHFKSFIENGLSDNTKLRYHSIKDMQSKFNLINFK